MERGGKVGIFLIILAVGAIIIAIFALRETEDIYPASIEEYEENICSLNDTIRSLKEDISKYKLEVARIDLEREKIKKELELILRDNEKVDTELANGDWDANIKFLTDFLSEEDTMGK